MLIITKKSVYNEQGGMKAGLVRLLPNNYPYLLM